MLTVTPPIKVYSNFQVELAEDFLKTYIKGLKVEAHVCGVTKQGFIQVMVSGEDESIAQRYLAAEIGLCPTNLEQVKKFSQIKGYVILNNKGEELNVDIGVSSPKTVYAKIPLQQLQAQLADGRKLAPKKLMELFGICENMPILVKISRVDVDKGYIEAILSEKQITQYRNWTRTLLDKLIIIGASNNEILHALKTARCYSDIVDTQTLGLFEHAITCKLGTDAAGIIPKIGKKLKNATLSIFNPRKILGLLEETYLSKI